MNAASENGEKNDNKTKMRIIDRVGSRVQEIVKMLSKIFLKFFCRITYGVRAVIRIDLHITVTFCTKLERDSWAYTIG